MHRISLYILLIMIYLGMSLGFSTKQNQIIHIQNESVLSHFFPGAPLTVVLEDSFKSGFLIKTYYQKYLIVHAFKRPYTQIVTTSKAFWKQNRNNHGMAIFRREERNGTEMTLPLPPGSLYIGDPSYGYWEYDENGRRSWVFHKAYRNFPEIFNWKNFVPDETFFQRLQDAIELNVPFYGVNNEFGTNGLIKQSEATKELSTLSFYQILLNHIKNSFSLSPVEKGMAND